VLDGFLEVAEFVFLRDLEKLGMVFREAQSELKVFVFFVLV
jgi:hypothetical protein